MGSIRKSSIIHLYDGGPEIWQRVAPHGFKLCRGCDEVRPRGDFLLGSGKKHSYCPLCRPLASLYRKQRIKDTETGHTELQWLELLQKYGHKCLCCGTTERITRDHIIPVHAGGTDDISNIQPLCHSCNSQKGATAVDYRLGEGEVNLEIAAIEKKYRAAALVRELAEDLARIEACRKHLAHLEMHYAAKAQVLAEITR